MRFAEKTILSAALILLVALISSTVLVHKMVRPQRSALAVAQSELVTLPDPTATTAPTSTPAPTATPNCSDELATYRNEYVMPQMAKWGDAMDLAYNSPRITLPSQISQLQAFRRDIEAFTPDPCATYAHSLLQKTVGEMVDGFMGFLGKEPELLFYVHERDAVAAYEALKAEIGIADDSPSPYPTPFLMPTPLAKDST